MSGTTEIIFVAASPLNALSHGVPPLTISSSRQPSRGKRIKAPAARLTQTNPVLPFRSHRPSPLWKIFTGWLTCFLLMFLFPSVGHTGNERIAGIVAQITDSEILVSAHLIRGFSQTTEEDIQNGIPKDLFYYVLLKRRQPLWIDEEMLSKTIKYTVKYDLLKKQYNVTRRMDQTVQQEVTENFGVMKRLISTINNVKIAPTDVLNFEDTYYISIKAEMKAAQLPFYLDYFLFFIPFLEVDTPWAHSSPLYKQ